MNWVQYHRLNTLNSYIDCLADDHRDKVYLGLHSRKLKSLSWNTTNTSKKLCKLSVHTLQLIFMVVKLFDEELP